MATSRIEQSSGLGADMFYGVRPTEIVRASQEWTGGKDYDMTLSFKGDQISQNITIPAGAIILRTMLDVRVAFALAGTTPAVEVGTNGSEATNGFTITEAQIEAVAITDLTSALSGTWDAEVDLAADTVVGIALSGTSPVLSVGVGHAVITITWKAGGAEAVA